MLVVDPPVALSVWSPQPVSSKAPATAIAPTGAIRDFVVAPRRVKLAVMLVPPAG
ncbi:hypothetical protein TPA0910_57670 [Streptomyces hygroscopicus subsp. sporocinereus]|uniref:Uncharacterized protein n=1 Tax=Streptomyces hygroscopicus TaxID=1912 RepID=A0ABQ3U6W1_STRHY|nr:hypothetical protein TPA0910_57670 [Streptomyces hygroscopicus]